MEWMLDIQLGRRNLSPIQRITIAEKYRSIYERQAKENMSLGGGDKKSGLPNLVKAIENKIDTTKKLADVAGVGTGTIARFNRVINSNKVAVEYVKLCGYKNGEIGNGRKKECQNGTPKLTLDEIASRLGTSKRDLQRALSIERNLTDSMKELLDTGVITKTLAADTIASACCSKTVTNIRQRGIGNPNPIKLGRCFQFLNDWYGFEVGTNQHSLEKVFTSSDAPHNQSELAESYGVTKQTMNNYMRLAKAIPELEELVDTGIVTKDTALAMMKELSNEEQIEMISSLDTTKRITKNQMQKYIDEIRELKDNPPNQMS